MIEKRILRKRYIILVVMMIATVCLLFSNVSASITPNYISKTLLPGDCYTVTKTVDIPLLPPKADVVFSFDLTSSMSGIISTAKTKATTIMNTLITSYPGVSFNFGVMSYMDYPHAYTSCGYSNTYGASSDYAYSLDQSLTASTAAVASAINGLTLGSGWDGPQDYTRIFYESYADTSVGWRTGAKKILVNFGDNVPHDCNLNQGVTTGTWSTGGDPGRNEIMGDGDDLDLQSVLTAMAGNNVILLECHTSTSSSTHWTYWTGITGGALYITSSATLVNDVVNAIVTGLTTPQVLNLHLAVTTPGYSSWLTSVVPPSYPVVSAGSSVTFTETICVPLNAPCGVHTFTVSALDASGVSYGDQINEITIPCDRIPPTTVKDHLGCVYYDPIDDVYYMKPCTPVYLHSEDNPRGTGVQFLHYELWWDVDCDGIYDVLKFSITVFDNDPLDMNPTVGEIDVELHIDQECCHKLVWYAVDNALNQEEPHEQFYRMDGTPPPTITKTHPDPCYFPINLTAGLIGVDDRIILEAVDGGIPPCISGVQDIYYGFWYEEEWHPSDPFDDYCGNFEITMYKDSRWWYTYNKPIQFHEDCKHILEYWAKDNACNEGPIHRQIYWVNSCKTTVWIDDDFGYSTPGWWHDHFANKQMALDWLGPGGTAYVFPGIYTGDIFIDDVPCCDNTGITQMGEYGCFPIGQSALIIGSETIKVNGVTIKYLEYAPNTNGAIIVDQGVSGTTLRCNKFQKDCVQNAIGVMSFSSSLVNAELNWWGAPDGPSGGKMDDGKTADGFGVKVIGNVDVEPWIGIHAEIAKPLGGPTVYVKVGDIIQFDASESWAYTYGECCQEPKPLPMQYLWDFDDGMLSANKVTNHVFGETGIYEVSLRVDSEGIPGLYPNFMYDWDNITIHVTETGEEPLAANAGGGDFREYETVIGVPVTLRGSAYGGEPPYEYEWDLGDGTDIAEQNPTHTYTLENTYTVTLKVIDSVGNTATDTAIVKVLTEEDDEDIDVKEVEILDVTGGFGIKATILAGTNPVDWSISVDGSVFFGGEIEGTIPADVQKTVELPFSLGFGKVCVTLTANSISKSYTAFMLGPFFLNVVQQ